MEGTHAHHCSIQEGGSSCCALEVDVTEASSATSPAPSLQCEERGHYHPEADSAQQFADYNLVGNGGDWQQLQGTSPCHHSLNSHIEGAAGPPHLPSRRSLQKRQGSSQCSSKSPSNLHSPPHDESWLSLPPCTLDPNAREFTPPLLPSLQITIHMPLNMQPVYTAHSGIGVSHVCYQTSAVAAMQGPCNYDQLVDTTLRIGPTPEEIVTANSSREVSTHALHNMEPGPSTLENVAVSSAEDDMSTVGQHMNGSSCSYAAAEIKASHLDNVGGFLTPLHERSSVPVYNPPILTNPHAGFLPPMGMPFPPPPPPMPLYPNPVTSTHPQQALNTVYTHKHFHPQFGWKEHISRALLISGIPPHLTESQLRVQLELWGDIRALYTDKLPQGILSVQFFDLRASRQALRDMQNQHLLRQQRFQEHLYAQSGMRFQNYTLQLSGAAEQGLSYKGLLGGYVVWAQYIAAWSVPVPDAHNQGTLVLFNVGADVSLERLQQVFEKYGCVRELREAPTKRQHKFVEFYDTRDAEAAWAALNGQEVCGKCVKIEFSRQGGPVRKQKFGPVLVQNDLVASGREVTSKVDSAFCAWQSHSTHGFYHQEWQARFVEGNPPPLLRPEMIMLPSTLTGPDDCLSYGSSMSSESGKFYVNHIQGAISGPRRKHCTARPLHPRVSDVLAHGKVNTLSLRPAETIRRNVSTGGHPHFEYNEREVYLMSGEPRTTLMIKNIPNKYSQQMLLSLLDHHCGENNSQIVDPNEPESAYDFVYLPIDFKNRCNLGYAFVNFTSALATLKFYKAFHLQAWEEFNSRKVCDIKYARVQGRHALENHFCSSRFACDTPDYLPVVFTPPRNGLQCPPPRVAAGLMMMKSGRPALAGISISSTAEFLKPQIQSLQKSEPRPSCDSTTINLVDDETKLLDFNGEPQLADGAK